jgi:CheY-like chemotaxis protein
MKRILLIDDEPAEFMYVNFLLKDRYADGYTLGHAKDMAESKDYLSRNGVDLILLDDRLSGGLTAIDTIPQLQRMAFNVPVTVITKNANSRHLDSLSKLRDISVLDKFELRDALAKGALD